MPRRSVRAVHREYLEAGADCVATVTYQATFEGFAARGMSTERAAAAFHAAVALAVEARDAFWDVPGHQVGRSRPLVAASIGPYGAYLADGSEYTGAYDLDEDALHRFHRGRWHLLAGSRADLLACETIPSLAETRVLLRLLAETPGCWAWISFQCRDEAHLADGTPLEEAVRLCAAERIAAVGVNCVPPSHVPALLARARSATSRPLAAYPNSGETYDAATKRWAGGVEVDDPAVAAPGWRERGASVLGGCCRTGPDTIRRMRRALLTPS